MRRLVSAAAVVALLYPACTFGSLASYTITLCNAGGTPNEQYPDAGGSVPDPCDALNQGNTTSCTPWQCDVATATCVQKTRDDDHDGDPPVACGGGDCDDTDPNLNSLHVDPGTTLGTFAGGQATPTLSYDGVTPVIASTNSAASCLVVQSAESPTGMQLTSGCTEMPPSGTLSSDPEQVNGAIANGVVASAFVSTNDCQNGELGIASLSQGMEYDTAASCPSGGTSLPALSMEPGAVAAVAYYGTAPLSDPLADCVMAVVAPLNVVFVENIASSQQAIQTVGGNAGTPIIVNLSNVATSVRPPAIASQGQTTFVASPDGTAVSIWALGPGMPTTGVPTKLSLPQLAGARGVSMGIGATTNGTTQVAVIGELDCTPQEIHVVLLNYNASPPGFTKVGDATLAPAGTGFQTAPTVVWSALRNHWLATWVASGPVVMGRFFDGTVTPSETAFTVPGNGFAAQGLANAHAVVVTPEDVVLDSKLRCP